ncbi:hypothetical protein CUMW_098940 [Citrus unshiu]|nr:hypothetical protein CUMW_098940 [Citrus unshiu]
MTQKGQGSARLDVSLRLRSFFKFRPPRKKPKNVYYSQPVLLVGLRIRSSLKKFGAENIR